MKTISKILLVEDELLIANVLKIILVKKNFEVKHVTSEEEAVQAATEIQPDLIILDIQLKNKGNGIQAAIKIRNNGIVCPIAFTTGNSYEDTKKQIEEIKQSHLFIKPVDIDQIIGYINIYYNHL
ncbi:MAG: response regulator [Sphingobacteriaceae bacterium]|nr:response regulator [Sphingobacteriaceae bacterium]